ncbi:MAG: energy transducer TonB family protein [Gammaproteobacteria bacterium]
MNEAVLTEGFPTRSVSRERLVTALVFALLAHGIMLLGIGFIALAPPSAANQTVAVTLVNRADANAPRKSEYLAQANQRGPGNSRLRVPQRPTAAAQNPFPNPGFALAGSLATFIPGHGATDALTPSAEHNTPGERELASTRADSRLAASGTPDSVGGERPLLLARLIPAARQAGATLSTTVALPRLYGPQAKADAHKTNARAAVSAAYLLDWQRRIERIGTAQFAQLVPPGIARGHLTLNVTVNADGGVRAVEILKRSQHPELDAAALKIIRLSAPFAPFPPELRASTTALSFTYRWNFIRGAAGTGSVGLGGG